MVIQIRIQSVAPSADVTVFSIMAILLATPPATLITAIEPLNVSVDNVTAPDTTVHADAAREAVFNAFAHWIL